MKYILLFLLVSTGVLGQVRVTELPEKTNADSNYLIITSRPTDGRLFKMTFDNLKDSIIGAVGTTIDTTSLSNRIDSNRVATNSQYWYVADEWGMVNDSATDNTDSLQALIDYIGTTEKNSVIYFSKPGTYLFSSALKDTLAGNAVIFFPTQTITGIQYTITLKGHIRPTFSPSVYSSTPMPSATILRITDINKANGGGAFFGGHVTSPTVNFVVPGFEDIIIATAVNPKITAVDFSDFTCTFIKDVVIIAGTTQDALNTTEPTHANSFGYIQPDDSHGINQRVEGVLNIFNFYHGARIGEGALVNDIGLWACKYGLVYNTAWGASEIGRAIIGWCEVGILVNGAHNINIRQFSSEHYTLDAGKWFYFDTDLVDVSNVGFGHIEWLVVEASVGYANFTQTGGVNITIHELGTPPSASGAGGSNTQVQYNSSGILAGDAGLVWNPSGGELQVTADVVGGSAAGRAVLVVNNNTSTNTDLSGNVGVYGYTDATTAGTTTSFLSYNVNRGAGASIGSVGLAHGGLGTGIKVGAIGRLTDLSSNIGAGGYFNITSGTDFVPPSISATAALIANNGNVAAPIFLGQDNGSDVFTIGDGGKVGIGVSPTSWLLDIKGDGTQISGNFYSNFRAVNSTPDRGFYFGYDNTSAGSGIIASNAGYLAFWTYSGSAWGERLRIAPSGILKVANAPVYADDTAAGVGGLTTGDIYQTSAGVLMIKQ